MTVNCEILNQPFPAACAIPAVVVKLKTVEGLKDLLAGHGVDEEEKRTEHRHKGRVIYHRESCVVVEAAVVV